MTLENEDSQTLLNTALLAAIGTRVIEPINNVVDIALLVAFILTLILCTYGAYLIETNND